MREYKNRARNKRGKGLTTVSRWVSRNRVSTDYWERELLATRNIHRNDWNAWSDQFDFAITWYGYKLAITVASVTAFFTGIGQLLFKLAG